MPGTKTGLFTASPAFAPKAYKWTSTEVFLFLKSRSYLPFSVERCVFSVVIRMLTVSTEPTDKKYVCNNVLNVHIVASIIATMCSWILQRNDL